MSDDQLKTLRRSDFGYILQYRTRWSDNDQYSHINNSIYYHMFDSVVNTYLIEACGQKPQESPSIGLVVSSWCQFFAPLSFPDILDRVTKLGRSDFPAAVGGYTHVFVDNQSRRSVPMSPQIRSGLEALSVSVSGKL
ncbi:HotDog domain-containing protein [Lentinula raphanica]|nr:HotDog domain-containing protein [Lentinula raphanica]